MSEKENYETGLQLGQDDGWLLEWFGLEEKRTSWEKYELTPKILDKIHTSQK